MIEAGSDSKVLNTPFDVGCTLLHIVYSKHPCQRADAAASLCHTTGLKTRKKRSHISRGLYNKGS